MLMKKTHLKVFLYFFVMYLHVSVRFLLWLSSCSLATFRRIGERVDAELVAENRESLSARGSPQS